MTARPTHTAAEALLEAAPETRTNLHEISRCFEDIAQLIWRVAEAVPTPAGNVWTPEADREFMALHAVATNAIRHAGQIYDAVEMYDRRHLTGRYAEPFPPSLR